MASVNFTDLIAQLGDFHRAAAPDYVIRQLLSGMQSVDQLGINVQYDIKDEQEYAIPFIKEIVQPADPENFSATANAIDFIPRRWKVRGYKADLSIIPQQFKTTFLAEYENARRSGVQLTALEMFYNMIMRRIGTDIEKIIWRGVYNALGTTSLDVTDGFLETIADAIVATSTVPVPTGPITAANAVTSLELMYLSLPGKFRNVPSVIMCSPQIASFYVQNHRQLYGDTPEHVDLYNQVNLAGPTGMSTSATDFVRAFFVSLSGRASLVMPVNELSGSGRVIIEVRPNGHRIGNMLGIGFGAQADLLALDVEKDHRKLDIMADGAVGVQIGAFTIDGDAYVRVNDQA